MRIGWLSTGRDEEARRLFLKALSWVRDGRIRGKIVFVFVNRERGENPETDRFLNLVEREGVELITLSSSKFGDRREFERRATELIEPFEPDICFLCGYMLIVGEEMCGRFRMLNLHPALPGGPRGAWEKVMMEIAKGDYEEAGAMIHIVTPELDRGPCVSFFSFPIKEMREKASSPEELARLIREKEFRGEIPLVLLTLRALSLGEIDLERGVPLDLSEEVRKWL